MKRLPITGHVASGTSWLQLSIASLQPVAARVDLRIYKLDVPSTEKTKDYDAARIDQAISSHELVEHDIWSPMAPLLYSSSAGAKQEIQSRVTHAPCQML